MKRSLGWLLSVWMAAAAAESPSLRFEGEAIQGGLMIGHTDPGARVSIDGQPVRVSNAGVFLVGFDRDAPDRIRIELRASDGASRSEILTVARRNYDIQRIDGLPPAQVTPPPEVLERIRDDARRVRAARDRDDDRQDFLAEFQWPAEGPISGVFGSQRVLNGEPRRPHYGVDVAAPEGAPVVAPAPGIVTLAEPDLYYSGGTLIIDHGHGLSSTFLHLSAVEVEVGERVEAGQPVGRVGSTGRATGPHLDWRMNLGSARIDPQRLVPPR